MKTLWPDEERTPEMATETSQNNHDIVTRLRQKYGGQLPICAEAADEIERLRARLAKADDEIEWWSRVAIEQQRMKWEAMDQSNKYPDISAI